MTARKRLTLILLWALSLIIVGVFAYAQAPTQRGTTPTVLSGSDIGFRVERPGRDAVAGTFVVRINGEWVRAEPVEAVKAVNH
jgi:hypothetical protein